MSNEQEIIQALEETIVNTENVNQDYKKVLATTGEVDVTLADGSTTPNLNKRVRTVIGEVPMITDGNVALEGGGNQREFNTFVKTNGAALPWMPDIEYALHATVIKSDGTLVQSTVAGNKTNPNDDMTGWGFPPADKNTSQKLQKAATANAGLGYSKRLIANIPFKYPDFNKHSKVFGQYNCFPQGFTFDPVESDIYLAIQSNSITTIAVWNVSDSKKPVFKTIFKLDGVSYTNEGLIVKREGGIKNLYFRDNQSRLCKIDITIMPTAGAVIPQSTFINTGMPTARNFSDFGGYFILSRSSPPIGSDLDSRSSYAIYDKNYKIVNSVKMHGASAGVIEGSPYSEVLPKIQGFGMTLGGFVGTTGGGLNDKPTYTNVGTLVWDESGSLTSQNIVTSDGIKNYVSSELKKIPHHCEAEGIYSSEMGDIYSLVLYVNEKNQEGAESGGVMIFEEFSTHSDAYDFSKFAAYAPTPSNTYEGGLYPLTWFRAADGSYINAYFNPFTADAFKSWKEICDYMLSSESSVFSYYANSGATILPLDMVGGEVPSKYGLVTIFNCDNNLFTVNCSGVDGDVWVFKLHVKSLSQRQLPTTFSAGCRVEATAPQFELRRVGVDGVLNQVGQLQISPSGSFGLWDNSSNKGWVIMGKPDGTNFMGRDTEVSGKVTSKQLKVTGLRVFQDNTTAKAGGLLAGDVYRTGLGQLMIVY